MTPDDAFMQTICEKPDDDFPRLRYADYLEENGQIERAEFIRVQCELWKDFPRDVPFALGTEKRYERWRFLQQRERELLAKEGPPIWGTRWRSRIVNGFSATHAYRWMPVGAVVAEWCEFQRGFVSKVIMTAEDWLLHADALTAATPLQEVVLTTELDWYAADCFFLTAPSNREIKRKCLLKFGSHWGENPPVIQRILDKEWPKIKFTLMP